MWSSHYTPIAKKTNSKVTTQIVTCEEFNWKVAFNAENTEITKLLFEGEGAQLREGLYLNYT
jgi:hypothetical protein